MKLIILPVALLIFTFFCLCGIHIDNINKLENSAEQRKVKLENLNDQQSKRQELAYSVTNPT